jgi:putative tricarboxylic transport membrane protein
VPAHPRKQRHRRAALAAGAAALALVATGCASGESTEREYSANGTIRVVVAMAAGGGSDRSARAVSSALNGNDDGYSTVVENREGGGGAVGWSYFYGLAGEPQHLLVAETALHTLPRQEGVDLPFTYEDFTPIGMFAEDSRLVVAPADSPYDTCAELIEGSRSEQLFSGISGTYGADGMVLTRLEEAGLEANRVPFGSSGEVVTAMLGGLLDVAPASAASVRGYIESGDFKGLCTLSEQRIDDEVMGDIPTAVEQGLDEARVLMWRGVLAPGDLSEQQRDYWVEQLRTAVQQGAFADYLEADMLIPKELYGDEFAAYLDEYDQDIAGYFG